MNLDYSQLKILKKYTLFVFIFWVLGFLLCYFFLDQELLQFIGTPEREPLRLQMREITDIGLASHYFIISAIVYFFCRFFGPKYLRLEQNQKHIIYFKEWSKKFFIALLVSGLFNEAVKIIFSRQRPHLNPLFDEKVWRFFSLDWDFHSFPSGHTQVMFCVATMLGYAWPRYHRFFLIFASMIGFTRIGTLYHFPSDVLTGAAVGHLGTIWCLYFFDKRRDILRIEKLQSRTEPNG